jgi:hypothetical protein
MIPCFDKSSTGDGNNDDHDKDVQKMKLAAPASTSGRGTVIAG